MKIFCTLITFLFPFTILTKDFNLTLESGALWQIRNDVRIPGNTGTLVSFDEYSSNPFIHYRIETSFKTGARHGLRLIYAPLNISVNGEEKRQVNFNNQAFNANQPLSVDYTFNSYRVGYFYQLFGNDKSYFNIGITGKIRDAEITFSQNGTKASYDNLGFVPLFYYALRISLQEGLFLYSDADFAVASQGRAIDATLKLKKNISSNSLVGFGLRVLEGGADNDKVYTFSQINYLVIDFSYLF